MINTRNDLRQGTLWKQILFFSLPIAATSMLQQLFNSADVAVVGRFSAQKDLALAAVGSTSSVVNLFITIITGLAVGANVVIARSIGASDEKRAKQAVHTALILSLLCGAILLVLVAYWISLPLLVVGLFFGCKYRFSGPDLDKNRVGEVVNQVSAKVGDAVGQVRDEFKREFDKSRGKKGK